MKTNHPLLAVLAVSLLALAACGDDDEETTATEPAATSSATGAPGSTAAPGSTPAGGDDYQWVMVTDQAGLGDQGFNDLAKAGLDEAASTLGGTAQAIESSEQAQYVPNLQQAIEGGASLTVGVGFLITDAIVEVAGENPDANLLLIDAVAADESGAPLPNVASVTFKEQEGAYLAGVIAASTTQTKKIGFVGGIEIPPVVRFLTGFREGVASVDDSIQIDVAYVGAFDDPARAKELTAGYFDSDHDIVFEVAGAGGLGSYEEAKTRGEGFWVIGTDTCKDDLAPDNFLTSATKDVSGAVLRQAQAVADGSFAGGVFNEGLAEDAVGVCEETFGELPQEVRDAVEAAREAIASGELTVSTGE